MLAPSVAWTRRRKSEDECLAYCEDRACVRWGLWEVHSARVWCDRWLPPGHLPRLLFVRRILDVGEITLCQRGHRCVSPGPWDGTKRLFEAAL